MTTLANLTAEALSYIASPDDTEANDLATAGVNDAIRKLDSRNWGWALMTTSITLTASNRTYDLPDDFRAVRHASLLDGSGNPADKLPYLDPKSFLMERDGWGLTTAPGDASYYTVMNNHETNDLELDVAPSSQFITRFPRISLRYYRKTARLATALDTFDAPSAVEAFVAWHAAAYVASRFAPEKQEYATRRELDAWQDLVRDEIRSQISDW